MAQSADSLDDLGHGYPRPMLRRKEWTSLNGEWDFAIDAEGHWNNPDDVEWTTTIMVPFAPESRASGIGRTELFHACWYRGELDAPEIGAGERLLLHFGAIDYQATVWVNNSQVATHQGGYTPFTVDISYYARRARTIAIVVHAQDDPHDLAKPRGKQDWLEDPHSIWYHRTSGIWQTVWLERVSSTYIDRLRWTPNLERWEIGFEAWLGGDRRDGLRLHVKMRAGDSLLVDDTYTVVSGEAHRRIALSDPGIDDYRNGLLWNPTTPTLIDVEIELWGDRGELLDEVASYTALRSVSVESNRFILNARPYTLRMVLDQGYWPESGATPPDDHALRADVELAKAMGFNGVRKHQKIENPRYLFWADRLGLLVWEEMPSAYRFTQHSVHRLTEEWTSAIERDSSHPCICAWVPINESWGVPNLPSNPAERHYVRALYNLTKTLDPTRPVIGNDGWESVATDIVGIHDYDSDPERIARRYPTAEKIPRLFKRERPAGRLLVLDGEKHQDQPIVLSEFGGITCSKALGTWGYSSVETPEQLAERYRELLAVVHSIGIFCGFCYTQFADTYQEANGLLYADRTPKFPLHEIAAATTGTLIQPDIDGPLVGSMPVPLLRAGSDESEPAPSE
jgi:beta-galactosidase/beta-glucuronidase